MSSLLRIILAGLVCFGSFNAYSQVLSYEELAQVRGKLLPLHKKLAEPKPGEWLYVQPEPGQSFEEYLDSKPVSPQKGRDIIYIQPLGKFTSKQRKIVDLTGEFLSIFYNLKVKILKDMPLEFIPKGFQRRHPVWGDEQINSIYILEELLIPSLPDDAAVYLAFTSSDLWPGENWNFVFGQASLKDRVGVWSIYRNGDPEKEFNLVLLRTIKTAAHEVGHMFSMLHCKVYQCLMNGSNSRRESDLKPLALGPECLPKVSWITKSDPVSRYKRLAEFCRKYGLIDQVEFYEKSIQKLKD